MALRSTRPFFGTAIVSAALAIPTPAFANGRLPGANLLVSAPNDPNLIVQRATYGFLVSHDRGNTWDWICENAIGFRDVEDPFIGVTESNAIVAGMFAGAATSSDTGCTWKFAEGELTRQVVVDVVVRPDDPKSVFVITNKYAGADDAGNTTFDSRIFASSDNGNTWQQLGNRIDPLLIVETIEVARSNPSRLYVSGSETVFDADGGFEIRAFVLVSDDLGETWSRRDIPLDASLEERQVFVSAVDPARADRVYVRTFGKKGHRLLVSDDAGQTFQSKFTMKSPIRGFALSEDGSRIYIGGPEDGLHVADTSDFVFTKKSNIDVECLMVQKTTLFACSTEVSGFSVGASEDEGATFAVKMHLSDVRGPLACHATTNTGSTCPKDWPVTRERLGILDPEAGVADSGEAGAEPPPAKTLPGDCGCRETPGMGGVGWLAGAGWAAVCGAWVRRRFRRLRRD